MTGQLTLIPAAPKITERQQAVLRFLQQCGPDGCSADEAGAIAHGLKQGRWAHGPDSRCVFCGQDGKAILGALKAKGLARYRRARGQTPGAWLAEGTVDAERGPVNEEDEFGF